MEGMIIGALIACAWWLCFGKKAAFEAKQTKQGPDTVNYEWSNRNYQEHPAIHTTAKEWCDSVHDEGGWSWDQIIEHWEQGWTQTGRVNWNAACIKYAKDRRGCI